MQRRIGNNFHKVRIFVVIGFLLVVGATTQFKYQFDILGSAGTLC